jgi:(1->4)-alpha-D-glucan 1-alpha-D-glucosylmutase
VADHGALNPVLGDEADYRAWTEAMRERGLRHVADFVPNHVGIGTGENRWWLDVLENGRSSEYADFFDIDWEPPTGGLRNKVLLPVLGGQFGEELEAGRLQVVRNGGRFWLAYYERRFPLALESYAALLGEASRALQLLETDAAAQELGSILRAIEHLPPSPATSDEDRAERAREREVIQRRLESLLESASEVAGSVEEVLRRVNLDPAALEEMLLQQNYRLSYWRVATEEINYRRFFDVIELAAIRMEDPRVFDDVHALVFRLMADGSVTAVRLDHTDGLFDPEGYFAAFQDGARRRLAEAGLSIEAPVHVIAEKILQGGEELPRSWAISGTTGYDFLGAINGVWVDPEGVKSIAGFYAAFLGDDRDYSTVVYESKRVIMDTSMASEIQMLSHALKRAAERNRRARDFTLASLNRAVKETIAALSVYRTYVRPDGSRRPQDEALIRQAIRLAKKRNRGTDSSVFDFLESVLLLEEGSPDAVRLAMRFQQLTGPIMAKGVEDTAFYRYHPLACLNEVGGYPADHGTSVEGLHAHNAAILARWPLSMTTTTTHDTKRSEDVRARLAVLSEIPGEWENLVKRLRAIGEAYRSELDGEPAPSPNDEYLYYQTVVGAWPFEETESAFDLEAFTERLVGCMMKSAREAKERTSWIAPNPEYEEALRRFVIGTLANHEFVRRAKELVGRIVTHGACNSLSQLAIRLASPGITDVYQGMELWEFSLVDPDNRRPVDYGLRERMLKELDARGAPSRELATELLASFDDGRVKMHVLRTGLRMRREDPSLFLEGGYRPLETVPFDQQGPHVIAFERKCERKRLVCVAPRLPFKLTGGSAPWPIGEVWGGRRIELGGDSWTELFTNEVVPGGTVPLATILQFFPVAWLHSAI